MEVTVVHTHFQADVSQAGAYLFDFFATCESSLKALYMNDVQPQSKVYPLLTFWRLCSMTVLVISASCCCADKCEHEAD